MRDLRIVVIGAGAAGLAVSLGLARAGHQVRVLERDTDQELGSARDAFDAWTRPGVPHHRLPHSLLGRARKALRQNAPDVLEAMLFEGAWENNLRTRFVRDAAQPGDEDLVAVHCRRPFFECVLRRAVEAEPLVRVFTDTKVGGLTLHNAGRALPAVVGVETSRGAVDADIVIDAGGRSSPIRAILRRAGVSLPLERSQPCGVIYYSRYYRLAGADYPAWSGVLGPAGTTDCARYSVFFGDNHTFAVVLGVPTSLREFRRLISADIFTATVSRFPPLAPFVDPNVSVPITGVVAMGSLHNVLHSPQVDGHPPVVGLHFVGDSYCHTNPIFAWGLCLALDHGFTLARVIHENASDITAQSFAFAAATISEAEQCYRAAADEDHDRTLTWDGKPPTGPWHGKTFARYVRECAQPAVALDPVVARAVLRRAQLLDPPDQLATQGGVLNRIDTVRPMIPETPGGIPSRDELLALATGDHHTGS